MAAVVLGQLVKPLGLRGELKLRESEDFWPAALESEHLQLVQADEQRRVRVQRVRVHTPGMRALYLEGVADRTAAEAVVGAELVIDADELDVPEPAERRRFQVLDLEVVLPDDSVLGRVVDLMQMPAHAVFVVRDGAQEYLIPDTPHIVREIDWSAKRMRIEPIPGLLEL
ncbi:MAG: 16S rRNA processing protein RimM [Candidatus Latescibacterota bacterium]|nr:MAG: 16S rRNA processing protein RimM [Candidatus Latescibacterota bacterium]